MAVSISFLYNDFGTDGYHGKVLVQMANGSVQIANGSVQIANGSVQIAHGSIQIAHGSDQIAHGSPVQIAHGAAQSAHGSAQIAHGSVRLRIYETFSWRLSSSSISRSSKIDTAIYFLVSGKLTVMQLIYKCIMPCEIVCFSFAWQVTHAAHRDVG
jgi:X-X-X-Leu-X-X-Gly heptad repeat protein